MLATVRIARALDPIGYGFLGIVQVNAGLGVVLAGLGLRQVITRECARYPEKRWGILQNSAFLVSSVFFPVGGCLFIYVVWITGSLSPAFGWVSVLLLYGMLAWQLLESFAFGHERMEFSAAISLAGSVLWVVFAWGAPAEFLTPLTVCMVFALIQFCKSGAYLGLMSKAKMLRRGGQSVSSKFLLQNGMPFYWLAILTAASNQLPVLFLADRSGTAAVGFFSAGMKLAQPMHMMIMTLMMSLFPGLSRTSIADPDRYQVLVQRSLFGLVVCGATIATFVTLFRLEIVVLLFGDNFRGAANTVMLQIWYLTFVGVFNLIGMTLAASDRQSWLAKLATFYTLVAVPLAWFGSSYGATGLAATMLIAAGINMTYHWYFFQKSLPRYLSFRAQLFTFGLPLSLAIFSSSIPTEIALVWRALFCLILAGSCLGFVLYQRNRLRSFIG